MNQKYDKTDPEQVRQRRNQRLLNFFKLLDMKVRLIGDDNQPHMIYNNAEELNAYVKNFELHLTDNPDRGQIVYTVKLTHVPEFEQGKVWNWLNNYPRRKVYKISTKSTTSNATIYFAGFNFVDTGNEKIKSPIFTQHNPHIYFTKQKATEVAWELREKGHDVEVE